MLKANITKLERGSTRARVINIDIWDSALAYNNFVFHKGSLSRLNPRNPFQLDTDLIDYEMDSEDELAELLGEDVDEPSDIDPYGDEG